MSSQNPVFIPGPTNIPERLRHACNVPTIDHRSASFGAMFKPLFAGVKKVLKTSDGEVVIFPATGTAGWEAAISNTLSPGDKVLACRHGMFSHRWIDMCKRHGLDVAAAQRPLGRRRAGGRVPGRARGRQGPRDQGRPRHPQRDRDRRPLRRRRRPPRDGRGQAPGAPPRRRRQLDRLDGLPHGRVGRRRRRHRQPEGLHAARPASPSSASARRRSPAMETAKLPRCFLDFRDMLEHQPEGRLPLHPAGQPASTASASR